MPEQRVLSRQELFDLVWSKPLRDLAGVFGLSDRGLAKLCDRYGIPRPPQGHWVRVSFGNAASRPSLRRAPEGVGEEIRFFIPDPSVPRPEPVVSPEVASWIEREAARPIVVPGSVGKYHPLVRKAKDALEAKVVRYGPDDGWRWSGWDAFSIRVTKPHIGRACRIAHVLLTAFEARKFRVAYSREEQGVLAHVLGEPFKVSLVERQKRTAYKPTPEELRRGEVRRKFIDTPSGRLRLSFEYGWRKLQFEDGREPLEEQLNSVVLTLVRTVIEGIRPERERQAIAAEKRREEEQRRYLAQQKRDRFEAGFRAWGEQQERLRFVAALEEAVKAVEDPSPEVVEYVAWARRYVETAAPLTKFLGAVAKGERVYYQEFTPRVYGRY
jgi:hypothetical protein